MCLRLQDFNCCRRKGCATFLLQHTEAATGGVLWQKVFLEISQNSQESPCARVSFIIKLQTSGKHLCRSLFFNKVSGLRSATLLKKRPWHRGFPMNFAQFLRTPFVTEHLRWLLFRSLFEKTAWKLKTKLVFSKLNLFRIV